MSKRKEDSVLEQVSDASTLAENALDDSAKPVVAEKGKFDLKPLVYPEFSRGSNTVVPSYIISYPPSVTDQLANISLAEMINRGQGDIKEDVLDNFDFRDGKDDGSLDGHSLYDLEWADPASRFESEIEVGRKIRSELVSQITPRKDESIVDSKSTTRDTGSSSQSENLAGSSGSTPVA